MIVYILFAQRRERYPGQYAPEAVAIMDEFAMEENGEWMSERKAEQQERDDIVSAEIIEVDLGKGSTETIRERLLCMLRLEASIE